MVRGTGAISITIDSKKVEDMFRGYQTTLPKGARLGLKAIASKYAQIYLEQMQLAGITRWTGESFNVLKRQIDNPIRTGPNEYSVFVPTTLILLDQMRDHPVRLRAGRSITRWAATKGNLGVRIQAATGGFITVHRHPWIVDANRKGRRFVKRLMEKELNKKIRRKGKR